MYKCLHEFMDYHARVNGEKIFANDDGQKLSYAEVGVRINKIADQLNAMKLKPGDRVSLLGKNSVNLISMYLACSRLGVVPVGINYRLTSQEAQFIIEDAGARCLFADEEFIDAIDKENILIDVDDSKVPLPIICLHGSHPGFPLLDQWILQEVPRHVSPEIDSSDVLNQMYTSGTTGLPKGVLLTHYSVVSNAFQTSIASGYTFRPGQEMLVVAPMYHAAGLMTCLVGMMQGMHLVIHRDYDPVKVVTTLSEQRISAVTLVPAMLQFILSQVPGINDINFPDLELIYYGASPMSVDLLKRSMKVFECDFCQGYGQTENNSVLTILSPSDHHHALAHHPDLLNACGRAVLNTEVRIVDDEGRSVSVGESGEIVAKGPQVMKGYWNRPEATSETLKDGWLHTGDVGRLDEQGYLYILDRVKDMIISGGENIYPVELEKVLLSHPKVLDVAVIGISDEKWGEVPIALLVTKNQILPSPTELVEFCRKQIAPFKIPKYFELIDEIPRNPSGKILKQQLRESRRNR
jgi:acyl-CoA synthetase (AMP-forming)/AMP-acid ligase II